MDVIQVDSASGVGDSAAAPSSEQLWQAIADPDLRLAEFGACALVFNPTTWETHYVSDFVGAVLASIASRPMTVSEIAAELSASPEDIASLAVSVEAALKELAGFDLVSWV